MNKQEKLSSLTERFVVASGVPSADVWAQTNELERQAEARRFRSLMENETSEAAQIYAEMQRTKASPVGAIAIAIGGVLLMAIGLAPNHLGAPEIGHMFRHGEGGLLILIGIGGWLVQGGLNNEVKYLGKLPEIAVEPDRFSFTRPAEAAKYPTASAYLNKVQSTDRKLTYLDIGYMQQMVYADEDAQVVQKKANTSN